MSAPPSSAAAARRCVVFDDRHPIDMTALQSDPAFAGARVELLPGGTAIRMTQPPGVSVALSKGPQGWTVAALAAAPQPLPFAPQADNAQLSVVAREPGGVLAIADPATGGTLLVGTQRQAGQAMTHACAARRNSLCCRPRKASSSPLWPTR